LPAEVELIKSRGGVFEITAGQQLVYSKKATGVFPDQKQIIRKLEQLAT